MTARRPYTIPAPALALVLALTFLSGCDRPVTEPEPGPPPAGAPDRAQAPADGARSPVGPIPAEPQRPGDPEAGYRAMVNQPYVTCGLPDQAYRQVAPPPAPGDLLPGREGRNAELPYDQTAYTTPGGVELVVSNCLSCHAARFNGELVVGLGNEAMDWTGDLALAAERAGLYVEDGPAADEWRKWADRLGAIAPYVRTATVGVNPANNLTLALIAHHDARTLAWSDEPLLATPPEDPPPVSVPPWWRMKKKHALFYSSEGRGDHARFMMTAAILCTDTVDEARAIDRYFPDIRAWLASLEPPEYPFPVDRDLAGRGEQVFAVRCAGCHGRYGEDWTYPNLVVPLETVGTDPLLAGGATEGGPYIRWYNESFFGELARAAPAPGYVAPPLDGVWATAPYLHNGSVPTIEALLDSPARPRYWRRRSLESTDYDPRALGWRFEALEAGQDAEPDPQARKMIYDTDRPGYSNAGHTFGDVLDDAGRRAVLEYLKTL